MRNWINIVALTEGVIPAVDSQAIIDKLISFMKAGHYWDSASMTHKNGEMVEIDDIGNMARTWHGDEELDHERPEGEQFEARLQRWGQARYNEVITKLEAIPHHGKLFGLHRVMRVTNEWISKLSQYGASVSLGRFWTFDLDEWDGCVGAYSPWGFDKEGVDVLIHALAPASSIDWEQTIMANMDWMHGDNEYEMRLLPGAPVRVLSIGHLGAGADEHILDRVSSMGGEFKATFHA